MNTFGREFSAIRGYGHAGIVWAEPQVHDTPHTTKTSVMAEHHDNKEELPRK